MVNFKECPPVSVLRDVASMGELKHKSFAMSDATDLLKSHLSDGNFILNMSVVVTFVDVFQTDTTRSKEVADFIGYDPFIEGIEVKLIHVGGGIGKLLTDVKPNQSQEAS